MKGLVPSGQFWRLEVDGQHLSCSCTPFLLFAAEGFDANKFKTTFDVCVCVCRFQRVLVSA